MVGQTLALALDQAGVSVVVIDASKPADTLAPAFDGQVGVLPNHAPFMTLLGEGPLTVRRGGAVSRFSIRGGFLQVIANRVRVVTEHVQGDSHAS